MNRVGFTCICGAQFECVQSESSSLPTAEEVRGILKPIPSLTNEEWEDAAKACDTNSRLCQDEALMGDYGPLGTRGVAYWNGIATKLRARKVGK